LQLEYAQVNIPGRVCNIFSFKFMGGGVVILFYSINDPRRRQLSDTKSSADVVLTIATAATYANQKGEQEFNGHE
jgi:hypothetical protein